MQNILDWANQTGSLNPRKGLLLMGSPGNGKTTLMEKICRLKEIKFTECSLISRYVNESGISSINSYFQPIWKTSEQCYRNQAWWFDDLGSEDTPVNYFGTKYVPMANIIAERYNLWRREGWVSLFTTNCTPSTLESIYGERITDRLNEMCNIVIFNGESQRGK